MYTEAGVHWETDFYEKRGQAIISRSIHSDIDMLKYKVVYEFDSIGNETAVKDYENDSVTSEFKFDYDKQSNLVRSIQIGGGDFQLKDYSDTCLFTYDANNNLVMWKNVTDGIGIENNIPFHEDDSMELKYEAYDSNCNWIKKSIYRNGKYVIKIERLITYYKK